MDILIKKNELIKLEGLGEFERKFFIIKKIYKYGFMIYVKISEWLKKKKYVYWKFNINVFFGKIWFIGIYKNYFFIII